MMVNRTNDGPLRVGRWSVDLDSGTLTGAGSTRRLQPRTMAVLKRLSDSVTEAEMAMTIALEGGIGIVHRALPIPQQAELVRRVKRSHGAVIEDPWRIPRGTTIKDAKTLARKHSINALLIEENVGSGILAGLLTARDLP